MFRKSAAKKRRIGDFDKRKFVSDAAAGRYEQSISSKALIAERGFHNPGGRTEKQIIDRKWEYFTQQPSPACISVVREFYANAPEHKEFTVYVRGKWVPFDRATINRYYHLPDAIEDQYSDFVREIVDYDTILRELCHANSTIAWRRHDGNPVNFHSGGLTSESKAWHYFISAKLMPTSNTSEVTRDRAVLNYCIQAGLSVDVGAIIQSSILYIIRGSSTSGLGFPSLITDLCAKAGVGSAASEEMQHPRSALTKQKIHSYNTRFFEPGESSARASLPRSRPLSMSDQVGKLSGEVEGLKNEVRELRGWAYRKERVDDHRMKQHLEQYEYMADFNAAMEQMFINSGVNMRGAEFPEPPDFEEYQSPPEGIPPHQGGEEDEDYDDDDDEY